MLEDYYRMRGWDEKTGIPKPERLTALGLEDIAQDMEKYFR
jgi:aldehyde:ferredoxin oxidoreductase